jgi:hypothetical protein
MKTILNLVAVGALGAFLLGKVKMKTALIVGVGAVAIGSVMPAPSTGSTTTTA